MFIDHAGLALFPSVGIFRCIGRLAFPLYCFLVAQGFRHTRDIRAYARRLLLLALISEVPFDLLIFGRISSAMEQNVVFSLLLGLLALYAVRMLKGNRLFSAMAVFALMLVAMAARVSFGWLGVALLVVLAAGWLRERAGVSHEEKLRRKLIRLLVHKHADHLEYTDEHREKARELSRASVADSKQLRRDASTLAKDIVDRKANASPSDLVAPHRGEAVATESAASGRANG